MRFVFPLFASQNVRLDGWPLFFIKSGVVDRTMKYLGLGTGAEVPNRQGAITFDRVYTSCSSQ